MKKQLLLVLMALSVVALQAQDNKVLKDYYSFNGGLLGGVNLTTLKATGNGSLVPRMIVDYDNGLELGWSAGGWFNFPIGNVFAIEPQYMFSVYSYDNGDVTYADNTVGENTPWIAGNVQYHSIPILLKVYLGKILAIQAGPQFDFATGVTDKNDYYREGDVRKATVAINAGVELFPRGRLTFFARYMAGLSDLNNSRQLGNFWEFNHSNIQAGLKVRLFGGLVRADRDGDGIPDVDDKCPDVFGLERYMGCPIPDTDGDGINDELDKCPKVAGVAQYEGCPIPDRDGDGVNDEIDRCPDVKGSPKYNGCPIPDTDGDGVNDDDDRCPTTPGLVKYNGCPIPDTDGDGINDEEDRCPTVRGLAKYNGCPIPDTDGDGINDEEDRCPTIPGVAAMRGCPIIEEFNAHEVTFATGSYTLTTLGKQELNLVADYMKRHTGILIRLDGHTDSQGSDASNMTLSNNRANAAMKYLISQGIDPSRLKAYGHGETQPVADNATAEGRQKNRRVEVTLD